MGLCSEDLFHQSDWARVRRDGIPDSYSNGTRLVIDCLSANLAEEVTDETLFKVFSEIPYSCKRECRTRPENDDVDRHRFVSGRRFEELERDEREICRKSSSQGYGKQ